MINNNKLIDLIKIVNSWYSRYGYPPLSEKLTEDRFLFLLRKRALLHNTFVRGVKDPLGENLISVNNLLISLKINPSIENRLDYVSNHFAPETGSGRKGIDDADIGVLYTSNSINLGFAFTKSKWISNTIGKAYIVRRPIDITSNNFKDIIINSEFAFHDPYSIYLYNVELYKTLKLKPINTINPYHYRKELLNKLIKFTIPNNIKLLGFIKKELTDNLIDFEKNIILLSDGINLHINDLHSNCVSEFSFRYFLDTVGGLLKIRNMEWFKDLLDGKASSNNKNLKLEFITFILTDPIKNYSKEDLLKMIKLVKNYNIIPLIEEYKYSMNHILTDIDAIQIYNLPTYFLKIKETINKFLNLSNYKDKKIYTKLFEEDLRLGCILKRNIPNEYYQNYLNSFYEIFKEIKDNAKKAINEYKLKTVLPYLVKSSREIDLPEKRKEGLYLHYIFIGEPGNQFLEIINSIEKPIGNYKFTNHTWSKGLSRKTK